MKISNGMKKLVILAGVLALPLTTLAAGADLGNISTLVSSIGNIVNKAIPILFAIGLLGFFYGLVSYIFGADDNKDKAKKTMIWGVVALFVMASVWGLVNFIGDAVGVGRDNAPTVSPLIPK